MISKTGIKKEKSLAYYFSVAISFFLGYLIVKILGPIILFVFLIAVLIGIYFPDWYLKRTNVNKSFIKGIAWSNVISWFLPPLGLMVSIATLSFSYSQKVEDTQKYKKLAIVGLTLSIINSILGAALTILGVL